jgi:three-Cys-motif partner protein
MPASSHFFEDDAHEASKLKIEAYGKYLQPLAYKLLSWNRRLFIVDGFAGAGRYQPDDEGRCVDGSPMVAARFAHQYNVDHHREGRAIRLINVEKDRENLARLSHNLAGFGDLCLNILGRFEAQLDRILREVGRHPALFFLDSFGMQAADVRVIDYILERREGCVTEFLIHFSDRAITRIAGNLHANTRRDVDRRAAESKLRNLDEILGTSWWRGCFTNPKLTTAEQRCDAAAGIYMNQLEQRGIQFVNELRMRDTYDDPPRYRLIFATRNAHGTYLMNDIAAKHEAGLFKARFDGTFDMAWKRDERAGQRAALRDAIYAWGLERGTATPLEIYIHFTPMEFGRWETHDYDECLRELVALGGIDRKTAKGIKAKEKLRFIPMAQGSLFGAADA